MDRDIYSRRVLPHVSEGVPSFLGTPVVHDPSELSRYDAVFMGHTHRPFVATMNSVRVVNPGSCGLPRDIGNSPSFAVYNTQTGEAKIHRVLGNLEDALSRYCDVHPTVRACLLRKSKGGLLTEREEP